MEPDKADKNKKHAEEDMPIGRYADVIYSEALADGEDREAIERAEQAERRQKLR
jgi:hypothetical protein